MIWRRLKKYAGGQEQKPPPEEEREKIRVSFWERLVMTLSAYVVILLPCLLVLIGLCLLLCWMFGLL
ncbi:MAG: hypothetical protein K2P01_08230 [Oscillospiraceae bacterium]|nr:hypothetical protein [Oscillospiraceae bacterium]